MLKRGGGLCGLLCRTCKEMFLPETTLRKKNKQCNGCYDKEHNKTMKYVSELMRKKNESIVS